MTPRMESRRVRCFVAVEVEDEIRARLAEAQEALAAAGSHVRWSRPESLHVTLKFLGDIEESNVGAVCTIVESVAAAHDAFAVEVAGLGAFPNPRRPRVVFARMSDPTNTLAAMARALDERATAVGVSRDRRPFRPHLTLGRVKSGRGMADLTQALAAYEARAFGGQTVSQISLMRSELRPSGAVYTRLGVSALRKQAASA